jgi:hypothetical protein
MRNELAGRKALARQVAIEAAYSRAPQSGHDALSLSVLLSSFIRAPQEGQSSAGFFAAEGSVLFTFSMTSGFTRPWLKLWRTSTGSMSNFPIVSLFVPYTRCPIVALVVKSQNGPLSTS